MSPLVLLLLKREEDQRNAAKESAEKLVISQSGRVKTLPLAIRMALLDGYQRKRLIQLWEEEKHNDDNYVYANVSKRAKHEGINVTRQAVRYLIKKFKEGGTMETRQAKYRLLFGDSVNPGEPVSPSSPTPAQNEENRKELFKSPSCNSSSSPSQGDTTATVILATKLDILQSDLTAVKVDLLGIKETVRDLQTKFNTMVAKLALGQSFQAALSKETLIATQADTVPQVTETTIVEHLQQTSTEEAISMEQQSTITEPQTQTIETSSEEPVNEVQLSTTSDAGVETYQQQQFNADAAAVLAGLHSVTTSLASSQPMISNVESVMTTETAGKYTIPREVLEVALDECRSRTSMATSLVRLLFTPEERLTSNCRGVGKSQLDPQRIQGVMDACMAVFPPQADETPKSVRAKIRTAIDSSNRALRIKHRRSLDPVHFSQEPGNEEIVEVHGTESDPSDSVIDNTGQSQLSFQLPVSGSE